MTRFDLRELWKQFNECSDTPKLSFRTWKLAYYSVLNNEDLSPYAQLLSSFLNSRGSLGYSQPTKNNKEQDMYAQTYNIPTALAYAAAPVSLEETQRGALAASAEHTRTEKVNELRTQFGLSDQNTPRNAQEMIDRIKAGEYTFDDEYSPEQAYNWGYGYTWGLKWRKPDTKLDLDGFAAAEKLVSKDYEHLKQDVLILPLTDALAAVRAFEDKVYS